MSERILMDEGAIARMLTRLAHELVEHNKGTEDLCVIGIRRRGEQTLRDYDGKVVSLFDDGRFDSSRWYRLLP